MKLLLSHPTGNENVRAAAIGFFKAHLLYEYHTSVACFRDDILFKLGGMKAFAEIRRRQYDLLLKNVTHAHPFYETGRILSLKLGLHKLLQHETGFFSIDSVCRSLDNKVSRRVRKRVKNIDAIYSYEDFAFTSFHAAKALGLACFYDLPIGYWRTAKRILSEEQLRYPEWASTITGLKDSDVKLNKKEEELKLADKIYVASSFTYKTLNEYPGQLAPVKVIPYGFPPVLPGKQYPLLSKARSLKLLFVGGLSQRKGIADLFAAVAELGNHVQLTLVGKKPVEDCHVLNAALRKHYWIPSLPHAGILGLMRESDVLIFPSLFEGFGLVITEAMSQGTPVITTDRTAGPDFIKNGENGWLIEASSSRMLKEAIENILFRPSILEEVGREAIATAGQRSWETYGKELAEAVMTDLSN